MSGRIRNMLRQQHSDDTVGWSEASRNETNFGLHPNELQLFLSSSVDSAPCEQAPHPGLDFDGSLLVCQDLQ